MPNPVVHFEVIGKDAKKLQDFYSGLFGWQIDANNPMSYGVVGVQDGRGIGGGISAAPQGDGFVTFYVEVDDPQAYLDKVVSMGGHVVMPLTEIPGMVTFAQFADPEGHMVGIVKSEQPA